MDSLTAWQDPQAFDRSPARFTRAPDATTRAAEPKESQVGALFLERMRCPMILIDHQRRIAFRNRSARALLERRDLLLDTHDVLTCRDAGSDLELKAAARELGGSPARDQVVASNLDRRVVRLRRSDGGYVAASLTALREESAAASSSRSSHALVTVLEPCAPVHLDPSILSLTFELTPAESRLAVLVAGGRATDECAEELGVKVSTLRSQLSSIYGKTGASGKADLVRMVLSICVVSWSGVSHE